MRAPAPAADQDSGGHAGRRPRGSPVPSRSRGSPLPARGPGDDNDDDDDDGEGGGGGGHESDGSDDSRGSVPTSVRLSPLPALSRQGSHAGSAAALLGHRGSTGPSRLSMRSPLPDEAALLAHPAPDAHVADEGAHGSRPASQGRPSPHPTAAPAAAPAPGDLTAAAVAGLQEGEGGEVEAGAEPRQWPGIAGPAEVAAAEREGEGAQGAGGEAGSRPASGAPAVRVPTLNLAALQGHAEQQAAAAGPPPDTARDLQAVPEPGGEAGGPMWGAGGGRGRRTPQPGEEDGAEEQAPEAQQAQAQQARGHAATDRPGPTGSGGAAAALMAGTLGAASAREPGAQSWGRSALGATRGIAAEHGRRSMLQLEGGGEGAHAGVPSAVPDALMQLQLDLPTPSIHTARTASNLGPHRSPGRVRAPADLPGALRASAPSPTAGMDALAPPPPPPPAARGPSQSESMLRMVSQLVRGGASRPGTAQEASGGGLEGSAGPRPATTASALVGAVRRGSLSIGAPAYADELELPTAASRRQSRAVTPRDVAQLLREMEGGGQGL